MRALVIGGNSFIGNRLIVKLRAAKWTVDYTTRETLDLAHAPATWLVKQTQGGPHVVYICAAKTRFIDCEDNAEAYRINVDGPLHVAQQFELAQIIYLSSEAVERALHTNYGMHKALAEQALRTVCQPVIVRLSKVTPGTLDECCDYLVYMTGAAPGIYHWPGD